MDSDRVNRWLTLGANIGVLIGIILILADLMRAQMTQARGDNVVQTYRDLMLSDEWLELRARQRKAGSVREWVESPSPTEYERVWYRQLVDYHDLRTQFFQYQAGYLDERIWNSSSRSQARRLIQRLPYFDIRVDESSDDFREFLNSVARDSGLSTFSEMKKE